MTRSGVSVNLLILAAWVAVAGAAAAEEAKEKAATAVEVRIGAVIASNTGKEFDQRLASLKRPLRTLFPYSSYRLIKQETRRVEWMREAEFGLPGGRYLLVMPHGYRDGKVTLNVMLVQGSRPLVNTMLALKNNGTFLVGGPHLKQGGVLFVAIGAGTIP